MFTYLNLRRIHRVAHRGTQRAEARENDGIAEILSSENVRDDEVVGKAVDGLARVELAHGRSRFLATRFVAGQVFF